MQRWSLQDQRPRVLKKSKSESKNRNDQKLKHDGAWRFELGSGSHDADQIKESNELKYPTRAVGSPKLLHD